MRTLKFDNSDKMPALGLGTWKSGHDEVKNAIITAIKIGYRHIDCAPIYTNEKAVGAAVKSCLDEGIVKREDLWITSKLWNDAHKKQHVKPAIEKTLNDLGLDYIDLYLIHWPVAFKHGVGFPEKPSEFQSLDEVPLAETWAGMEDIKEAGLTRHIGTSNFSQQKLKHLMDNGRVNPEMCQVELHPYLQQQSLIDFCHNNQINVTAYSPLGSMDRPDNMKRDGEPVPLKSEVIKDIAQSHNCTPAQVLIAWALERNTAVIPKSTNEGRLKENFEAQHIDLSQADMEAIQNIDKGERIVDASFFVMEGNSYTVSNIWDE